MLWGLHACVMSFEHSGLYSGSPGDHSVWELVITQRGHMTGSCSSCSRVTWQGAAHHEAESHDRELLITQQGHMTGVPTVLKYTYPQRTVLTVINIKCGSLQKGYIDHKKAILPQIQYHWKEPYIAGYWKDQTAWGFRTEGSEIMCAEKCPVASDCAVQSVHERNKGQNVRVGLCTKNTGVLAHGDS